MKVVCIKSIKKEELIKNYDTYPIDYLSYLRWLDDEKSIEDSFAIVSTHNYDTNERSLWNKKGREIYNSYSLFEHSNKIISITKAITAKSFIVQHEYSTGVWLPKFIIKEVDKSEIIKRKVFDMKCFMPSVNLIDFDGGFIFEEDFKEFISMFIDYPFVFKYKNIDCISLDLDLIVKITHHLDVQFISKNEQLINFIKKQCDINSLKFTAN